MRLARIITPVGPRPAVLDGDQWTVLTDLFDPTGSRTDERYPQAGTVLLAPCEPRVVLGMAHNSGPADRALPPQAFLKSSRTVIGPGAAIVVDPAKGAVMAEAELAVVIGKEARRLGSADVEDVILGYTVGNDVTQIGQIPFDDKLTQVKNGDGFTPLGPWIETDLGPVLDGEGHDLATRIDGGPAAESSSANLAWTLRELLVYLTGHLTLGPGDVVLTGAPGTSLPIAPGHRVAVDVGGLGVLANPVVDERARCAVVDH